MRRDSILRCRWAITGTLLLLLISPAAAQEPPSPDELKELEKSLGRDRATARPDAPAARGAAQSMNPDIALILDAAGAWFQSDDPLQTGGHDPRETGFNFQQLEMFIAASVDPIFRLESNIVFALFGVEVEEAFGTTLALPWGLQARLGQFLTRFGRKNATHPHAWHFVDQPLMLGKVFGSEGSRGLGLEVSWIPPLPWYVEVLASSTGAAGECCARSFLGGDDLDVDGLDDFLYTLGIKQFFDFGVDWSLLFGLSAQLGPNGSGLGNRTEVYGLDLYLRYRPADSTRRTAVSLQIEALLRARQVPDDSLVDAGGYAELVWNIDPSWEIGGRYEYGSGVDGDPLDPEWDEDRHRGALQATYYPSHFSRVRLQGSVDLPLWRDAPEWSVVAAVELIIGAHGAHSF